MLQFDVFRGRLLACSLALLASSYSWSPAEALVTSQGQSWELEPDAWVRTNSADTAYFGWDLLDDNGPALSFGRVLDDVTPDLGSGTTASFPRIFQGADGISDPAPTAYGHRSGSGNYYSGFGDADFADDVISATTPASGAGGFTTIVLQVIAGAPGGNGAQALDGMQFTMSTSGWTKTADLYGLLASGTGVYWQEWTSAGGQLPFVIEIDSTVSSRSIDAFSIDTHWSADQATVNARATIGVPEPASGLLTLLTVLGAASFARSRRRAARPISTIRCGVGSLSRTTAGGTP